MQTPWGEIEVLDSHAHLFGRAFLERLNRQRAEPYENIERLTAELGWEAPPDDARLGERWVAEMDRAGVAAMTLMSSLPGDEDSAAEAARAAPDRLYGYFMFDPTAPDAEARARRAFDELGLRAAGLFPAMHRFSVADPRLEPIYRLSAERPGTLIFVHMGVLSVGVRKKLGLESRFDLTFSNPISLHPVALAFPRTRFVIPHFGAGFFREALMLGELAPNVWMDTSSSNSWMKFHCPDIAIEQVFAKALGIYGPERLLFGTDSSFFPRGWNDAVCRAQIAALDALGVGRRTAEAVLGGNLRALLKN